MCMPENSKFASNCLWHREQNRPFLKASTHLHTHLHDKQQGMQVQLKHRKVSIVPHMHCAVQLLNSQTEFQELVYCRQLKKDLQTQTEVHSYFVQKLMRNRQRTCFCQECWCNHRKTKLLWIQTEPTSNDKRFLIQSPCTMCESLVQMWSCWHVSSAKWFFFIVLAADIVVVLERNQNGSRCNF